MFVDIAHFWWAVPLSVAGLPAFFAVYYGIAAVVARRVGLSGLSGAAAFGLLWFLADYARGHMFTGFPWNLSGYAWSGVLPVLQTTSVIGIYGLSLITSVVACLPASLVERTRTVRSVFVASLFLFALLAVAGEIRLQTTAVGAVPNVRVRAIEEGLPLLRVANTGVSGIIDPLGRVKERLGLGNRGYIDGELPEALPSTLFNQFGEVPVWGAFLLVTCGIIGRVTKKK